MIQGNIKSMTTLRNVIINTAMVVVSIEVGLTVAEIAARLLLLGSAAVQDKYHVGYEC